MEVYASSGMESRVERTTGEGQANEAERKSDSSFIVKAKRGVKTPGKRKSHTYSASLYYLTLPG